MDTRLVFPNDMESRTQKALLKFAEGDYAEAERLLLALMGEATSDEDRYLLYLHYGEMLLRMERWEESRDALLRCAQIALYAKNDLWLVRSHEKLGDLSAAEENWFGALHHYRYALRNAASLSNDALLDTLKMKVINAKNMLHTAVFPQDAAVFPLKQEYISGPMLISFVHRDIFLKTFFARCLDCNFCYDQCCSYGADIDRQNVEKIQQRKEEILPFVRPPEGEWFDSEYSYYEEYTGGEYTRIRTQGPRCIFISKDQRGCGLHRYALSKGMDYHEIKPLVCILFPLSFGEGVLSVSPELDDNSLICSGSGISAYQAMKNELEYYFGRELVEELDGIEKEVLIQG